MLKLRIQQLAQETGATLNGEPITTHTQFGKLCGITSHDTTIPLWTGEGRDNAGKPTGKPIQKMSLITVEKIIDGFGLDIHKTTLADLFERIVDRKARKPKTAIIRKMPKTLAIEGTFKGKKIKIVAKQVRAKKEKPA